MKKVICILSISLMLGSCASLTKTQIETVNQFGETSKNFSAYPSKIMTELANVRLKRGVYYANLFSTDPDAYIKELDSVYNENKRDYELSKKVDITYQIIDKYAQSLILLSSNKYSLDLKKQSQTFGNDIDSLITIYNNINGVKTIPNGIGGLVSQVVIFGGDIYIKTKQGRQVKEFVPKADILIEMMTTNLKEFLNGKVYIKSINDSVNIQGLISNERAGFKTGYKAYLSTCARLKTLPSIESETDYLNTLKVLDGIDVLLAQTIKATDGLINAHKKLLTSINEKKKLTESLKELQGYYEDVKKIKKTIEQIENSKKL